MFDSNWVTGIVCFSFSFIANLSQQHPNTLFSKFEQFVHSHTCTFWPWQWRYCTPEPKSRDGNSHNHSVIQLLICNTLRLHKGGNQALLMPPRFNHLWTDLLFCQYKCSLIVLIVGPRSKGEIGWRRSCFSLKFKLFLWKKRNCIHWHFVQHGSGFSSC